MMKIEVTEETKAVSDDGYILICLRCGWQWIKRSAALPKTCANRKCHSPYWNRHRIVKYGKVKNINIFEGIEEEENPGWGMSCVDYIKSVTFKNTGNHLTDTEAQKKVQLKIEHKKIVAQALLLGKNVPENVVKEYKGLKDLQNINRIN